MQTKSIELKPIKESAADYSAIERKIKRVFLEQLYFPILKELDLSRRTLQNASNAMLDAIKYGRIQFNRGVFSGWFSASISKELKELGAKWSPATGTFRIPQSSLPMDVRNAVSQSLHRFEEKVKLIDKRLRQILPENFTDKIKVADHFDSALWKVEKDFKRSVANITVVPDLSDAVRKRISDEWQLNMDKWINDFLVEHIHSLREDIKVNVFAGNRYENLKHSIQKSYMVTEKKAKFLARQETNLLMSKYKESRYQEADINIYKWKTVVGSPDHPVRPAHKVLEGKYFRWDDPREVDVNGNFITGGARKPQDNDNPGEDYNCRCSSIPVVTFKKG